MAKKSNVLIISKEGPNTGAGKALYRIHEAIKERNNFACKFLAWEGTPDISRSFFVNENFFVNKIYRRIVNLINACIKTVWGPKDGYIFSHNLFPNLSLQSNKLIKEADIIVLGWIGFNYLSIGQFELFKGKKIVWRLSDVWPLTGGCHITFGCNKFLSSCNACPQLLNNQWIDLVSVLWNIKKNKYRSVNIEFIAPSNWIQNLARRSPLLENKKIHLVPTGVDLDVFKPMDKLLCKGCLNIDPGSIAIIFGSVDVNERRKGFNYLIPALFALSKLNLNIQLIVFGQSDKHEILKGINCPIKFLGRINGDDNLARVYNAADLFIAPYIEDNLPNTVIESIACGLPIVGFNSGGMYDLVDHKVNGYLAKAYDSADLLEGILWIISNLNTQPFQKYSVTKSHQFSMENQTNLIEEILTDL